MTDYEDALTLVTAPTSEPITDAELKEHLRLESDDEANQIDVVIAASRNLVEKRTGQALMPQTWELALRCFPAVIRIPKPPLQSVTSITYIDTAGASQTLASSEYTVNTRTMPGLIEPAYAVSWPSTRDVPNAVIVLFVAGYDASDDAAARTAVKDQAGSLRSALLMLSAELWENREDSIVGTSYRPTQAVERSLDNHVIRGYGQR